MNSGKNIQGILNYNENKVKAGTAQCIHENLYGREVSMLSFYDKLHGLENFSNRNRRATSKAVHISLNFHPSDKLDNSKLTDIADTYMEMIGFGKQPYLVYRHEDAAHPHIHIVTTNIQNSGERIILYNIGRNQSEKARKEIEKDFGLVVAGGRNTENVDVIQRAVYGKSETKRSISNALRFALRYKFTSLPELNAVLRQFNVTADRGKEGSVMHTKKGLLYHVLDKNGKKIGVPIKASSIYNKPTLAFLEKQFRLNEALRLPHKARLKKCIDESLNTPSHRGGKEEVSFIKSLNKQNIFVLFRKNETGLVYGITFVDNKTKVVFNGSDLGKAYSAKALSERISFSPNSQPNSTQQLAVESDTVDFGMEKAVDDLLTAKQYGSEYVSPHLRKKKRKKRRRSI